MIKVIAQFKTTLSSGISSSATGGVLESNSSGDIDGESLPNGDYGVVIDEKNGSREYATITLNGYSFTFIKRGLSLIDGDTEKTSNKFAHRKGAEIKIVNFPILPRMISAFNGEQAFEGVLLLPADRVISNDRHVVDKEYADSVISSGISSLAVSKNGVEVEVNVNSGYYSLNGVITYYAGASAQALVDDATNYIELTDGALVINQTGFDNDSMPLARAVVSSGIVTSLVDARAILGWLDIKTSYGIGRDSAGIFIDLDTDPALEFNSGKLRTKIKASSGIIRDANGLSVDAGTVTGKVLVFYEDNKLPVLDGVNLTNLSKVITASDDLLFSKDGETSASDLSSVILNSMRIAISGTYRVTFDAKISVGTKTLTLTGGSTHAINTAYQTFTADVALVAGEVLEISGDPAGNTIYTKNFRLHGSFTPGTIYAK